MNKAQFIAALAPHFNDSKKEAAHAVDIVFDTIVRNLSKGEDVMINDFGKFKKVDRKARMGRNPSKKARFLPAKALKEVISGDRKLAPAPKPEPKVVAKPAAKKAAPKKAAKKSAKKAAPKKAAKKSPAKKKPAAKKVVKKGKKK
jgi:DNA-binding protein HU-beta